MKKIFSKIAIIILLIFGFVLISGCEEEVSPKNGNGENKIVLPTETKTVKTDETIYVIYNHANKIQSIKSSNHFTDAKFFKYEVKGKFAKDGHVNITNSQADIELKEGKALIPSLEKADNFFYTLNLDVEHYKNKLPFNLTTTYKLDGNIVTFDQLVGKTGVVIITHKFAANPNANIYYQQNYAAQVQIPIDITTAKILENEGVLASVLVGTTNTLAYMIMPGETKEITLKLQVKNFKYSGMQAVYQPLDQISSIDGMLNFGELGINQLSALPDAIDQIVAGINYMETNLTPLFVGMDNNINQIKQQFNATTLGQFTPLINELNGDNMNNVHALLKAQTSYTAAGQAKIPEFQGIVAMIEGATADLNAAMANLNELVTYFNTNHEARLAMLNTYETTFQSFLSLAEKLNNIKAAAVAINSIDFNDIKNIIANKQDIIDGLTAMETAINEIKGTLAIINNTMYFYPDHFEPIAKNMYQLVVEATNLFTNIGLLHGLFTNLSAKIGEGVAGGWFEATMVTPALMMFKGGLDFQGDADNPPGLIVSLGGIVQQTQQMGLDTQVAQLKNINDMYLINPESNLRQIDEIYLGFLQFNNSLSLPQEEQVYSFYDGIIKLTSMKDLWP